MSLFTDNTITQRYLQRYPGSRRSKSWAGRNVHVEDIAGVWRIQPYGKPWVMPFEMAIEHIKGCPPSDRVNLVLATCDS